MLLQLFAKDQAEVKASMAFIAGDRQSDGVFNGIFLRLEPK